VRMPHSLRIAASVLPLVLGTLAGVGPVGVAGAEANRAVSDPTGDVKNSESSAPMTEPRADIVEAVANYASDGIELKLKTSDPTHPKSDANWEGGFTVAGWAIDLNNDNKEEYQLEYGREGENIYGDVYPPAAPAGSEPLCRATEANFRDGYYRMVVDQNCLGSPESFYYRALMIYTRDPANETSPQAEDLVPNAAWEGPISLPGTPDPGTTPPPDPGNPSPDPGTPGPSPGPSVPAPPQGYWLVARDGGIFSFGSAKFFGSTGHLRLNQPIVGMTGTPGGQGYWFVAADGGIFSYGDAKFYGSTGARRLNKPIVGMAATPTGKGYWLVATDGGIFAFGDAGFYGSTGAIRLNKPIVGMAATPTGKGYWLVASDGGIFAFGDAGFYGSTGSIKLNKPITGMSASPTGRGYWFVANDGGIFAFGDVQFYGSGASFVAAAPVVGMTTTAGGDGYRLVRADGGLAHYGKAQNKGSMTGKPLAHPVVGMAISS
jgi:ribosomal protein L24E